MLIMVLQAISFPYIRVILGVGSENLVKISGVAGVGYLLSDMLLKDYSYVIAFAYVREPSNINMDIKLSKLYLDTNNSMREESIASYRENNLVSAYYSLNNGYIRTVMWNDGKGYVLFFGFK